MQIVSIDAARLALKNQRMNKAQLAENIRTGRARLNQTRVEFAREVGITTNTLRALELGTHTQTPDIETLQKVAKVLGTTVEQLFIGKLPVSTSDPLLADLTEEDLLVARSYHHAQTKVRERVQAVLRDGTRDLGLRIAALAPELVASITALVTQAEPASVAETNTSAKKGIKKSV